MSDWTRRKCFRQTSLFSDYDSLECGNKFPRVGTSEVDQSTFPIPEIPSWLFLKSVGIRDVDLILPYSRYCCSVLDNSLPMINSQNRNI